MSEHIVSRKTYFAVYAALMALTATTVAVSLVDLGPLSTAVALAIAAVKATLVVLIFMHVKFSGPVTKLFVVGGLFWLGILLVLTFNDYISRNWLPPPPGW